MFREVCLCCGGSGLCLHCEGWGSHWSIVRGRAHREPCAHCSGVGACTACGGRGRTAPERDASRAVWRWSFWPFAMAGSH